MKTKLTKGFSILLFLVGLGLVLYPFISRTFYDYYFRNEAVRITESFVDDELSEAIYNEQLTYNQSAISKTEEIEVADVSFVEEDTASAENTNKASVQSSEKNNNLADERILGIMKIPKINLVYPIYDGATHQNLIDGVARIDGTSFPVGGINTNSVIAGHNGLVGRTYFSNIKKLGSGDIIYIENRKETLTYKVYDTAIIEPKNTAALAVIPGQDTLTLLTCTWPPPGTHRLLVYAQRVAD